MTDQWQSVPVEPIEEMRRAGYSHLPDMLDVQIDKIWASMLAVAPRPADELARLECEWFTHDSDWNCWLGTCGIEWMLEEDGPEENGMNYCPQCGGKLRVKEGGDGA